MAIDASKFTALAERIRALGYEDADTPGGRIGPELQKVLDASRKAQALFSPDRLLAALNAPDPEELATLFQNFLESRPSPNWLSEFDTEVIFRPAFQQPALAKRLGDLILDLQESRLHLESFADGVKEVLGERSSPKQNSNDWVCVSYLCTLLRPGDCLFVKPQLFDRFARALGSIWKRPTAFNGRAYMSLNAIARGWGQQLGAAGIAIGDFLAMQILMRHLRQQELEDRNPVSTDLMLVGSWESIDSEFEDIAERIKRLGAHAFWFSYPIRDDVAKALREQGSFDFLIYGGVENGKRAITHRFTVDAFETKAGLEGLESPFPEFTRESEVGKTSFGPSKSEAPHTWFRAVDLERLPERIPLSRLIDIRKGQPMVPQALINGFGNVRFADMLSATVPPSATPPTDFLSFVRDRGFQFPVEVLTNYVLSLQTKPFVLLTGISGTGKTKIAQLLAEFLCRDTETDETVLPADSDSRFYYRANRTLLNQKFFNLSKAHENYFEVPEKGDGRDLSLHIEGGPTVTARLNNVADVGRSLRLYPKAEAMAWIQANVALGGILRFEVVPEGLRMTSLPRRRVRARSDRYAFIPVRPDWTDHRGLLGYYNPIAEQYHPTEFLKLLIRASEQPHVPHFAILDEMNLAKVEHYFSDFLSCLESRRLSADGTIVQETLELHPEATPVRFEDATGRVYLIPPRIEVPMNLYFTGTVNVDESTYMFSPKVLDRANTLEFDDVDLTGYGLPSPSTPSTEGFTLRADWPGLAEVHLATPEDYLAMSNEAKGVLIDLLKILQPYRMHFGYRVVNEISRYVRLSQEFVGPDALDTALDLQIRQKILPKFHGSRATLEKPLKELAAYLGEPSRFPRSAEKVAQMLEALRADGYASFIR